MELVDLYDENRIPLGKTAERHAVKGPGEYRMVVHVCLFDSRGRLLIQKRTMERPAVRGRSGSSGRSWGILWTSAACGPR